MNYDTFKIHSTNILERCERPFSFEIANYLENCDERIFNCWRKRFENKLKEGKNEDKSLAYTLSNSLLKDIRVINENNDGFIIFDNAFQHSNSIDHILNEIFFDQDKDVKKFLIITQNTDHKTTFDYDESTITISNFKSRISNIFKFYNPNEVPELYFLVLKNYPRLKAEIRLKTNSKKTFIYLKKND